MQMLWDMRLEPAVHGTVPFGTQVPRRESPYNRSKPIEICTFFAKGHSGPCFGIGDHRTGAGIRQLPECVYLSPAASLVGGTSRFGLPQVPAGHSFLRQRSRTELADPARPLPQLQSSHLAPLSRG